MNAVRRTVSSVETNWRVLAFNTNGRLYSIVAINAQQSASTLVLKSDGSFSLTQPTHVYRTSPTEDYVSVASPQLQNGQLTISAPAMSIYTIFFQ
jgi:hypothetical protein